MTLFLGGIILLLEKSKCFSLKSVQEAFRFLLDWPLATLHSYWEMSPDFDRGVQWFTEYIHCGLQIGHAPISRRLCQLLGSLSRSLNIDKRVECPPHTDVLLSYSSMMGTVLWY